MAKSKNRMKNEINASSMADIAFLLLIFFLVTTTIAEDKGILVKLPPWSEEELLELKFKPRNVYSVLVNAENQLLVRGQQMKIAELRDNTKEFIANPTRREDLSESPTRAIISLKNDRGTNYGTYLEVYNELQGAYNELWEEEALRKYNVGYSKLTNVKKRAVRNAFPLVISEAEPTSYGTEN
ncbi:MAG: biopolymer transporter ExbD [Saprospirales bacterium]|jgi:biopolymer transport protein ExbD|nr:biopolymer transporter ExbD [Saprospirales bacterium]MBK7335258.1 biopolymer transporter ExbD [Saprospirales bacterium]